MSLMTDININSLCHKERPVIQLIGKVYDAPTEQPLPFANVYLSDDTTFGVAANLDGEFELTVPLNSRVSVSFVGYHTAEFIAMKQNVKVLLRPDDQLDTVYLEGHNKKGKNGWLWLLLLGGLATAAIATSDKKQTKSAALGQPMKVKI